MSDSFELKATSREDMGKGASRRLRRLENKVPAVVYGGKEDAQSITIDHDALCHQLENEAFFSAILKLDIDGKVQDVLLKDLQRHPAKSVVMHADFLRVDANQAVVVNVPLHFINEEACHGVKMEGGRISHTATEIEVRCLPKDLPEYIEVDMIEVNAGDVIHISDIKLPEGVESVALAHGAEHDLAVANCAVKKGKAEDDEDGAGEADAAEGEGASEE